MKIFCNNLKCKHCEKVENPEVFRKNKFFVPLFEHFYKVNRINSLQMFK